jgi:hypothetical protein
MYLESVSTHPQMPAANTDPNARLPWPLAVIFCFSVFFIGTGFVRVVPLFSAHFDALRVEIPWRTLPLFSFPAIVLAAVRQAVSLTKMQRRAANVYPWPVALVLPGVVVLALYQPMLELTWKAPLQ